MRPRGQRNRFALKDAAEAHRALEARETSGSTDPGALKVAAKVDTLESSVSPSSARRRRWSPSAAFRRASGPSRRTEKIDLDVRAGENHALLGENGAGKSTLVKMLYGLLQPSAGEILWQGRRGDAVSPEAARALGIGMVFQHFSLFENLTVAENIALVLPPERQSRLATASPACPSATA